MNVCNPLWFSIRKREGVGGITQINVLCGNICRADCRTFVPLFAVLPLCCSPIFWGHGQLWDHGGAELRAPGGAVRLWGCRVTPRTSRACSPLCAVQCVRTVQQQNLNLLGRTSPSRSTGSHRRITAFPCLMGHQQWNIVILCVEARVIHCSQLTFHWTVVNCAWLTKNSSFVSGSSFLTPYLFPVPSADHLGSSAEGVGAIPRWYQPLLPLSLQIPSTHKSTWHLSGFLNFTLLWR